MPQDASMAAADGIAARFELAKAIARDGGAVALGYFRDRSRLTVDTKLNGQDVVSIADREVETLLRARIAERFPEDGILGEEFGSEEGSSGFAWVMDPVDGTSPFVFGIPAWCVSIAVVVDGIAVAGTIFAPATGELYAARRGGGAEMNGTRLAVLADANVRTGVVGVGANHRVPGHVISAFIGRLLDEGGMFIRNGSGALMLAYVAAGRLAAYWEPHMNAWDCLAGLLLVEEAGGWIADPREWESMEAGGLALAGSPGIRDDMHRLLTA